MDWVCWDLELIWIGSGSGWWNPKNNTLYVDLIWNLESESQ